MLEVAAPDDEDARDLIVEELMAIATRGVEERDGLLVAHLPEPVGDPDELVEEVRARLRRATGIEAVAVRHRWQPHEEWSDTWRRGLRVRRITPRLVVAPSWEEVSPAPGERLIVLDPGLAFGTAEHPTTRGCLRLLEGAVESGDRIADVGAGSGILSVAAALLGADDVLALEMDPWAVAAARENAAANGVDDRVRVVEERVTPERLAGLPPFDGIVANIEAGVLTALLPALAAAARPGGWIILSGILDHEAPAFRAAAGEAGLVAEGEDREAGWWSGRFSTPAPARAASEPAPGS